MRNFIIISSFVLAFIVTTNTLFAKTTIMSNVQKHIDASEVVLIGNYISLTTNETFGSVMSENCQNEITTYGRPSSLARENCQQKSFEYTVSFKNVEGIKGDANALGGRSLSDSLTKTGSTVQITLTDYATASSFVDQPFSVLFLTKTFVDRGNSDPSRAPTTDWKILESAGSYNFKTLEEARAFLNDSDDDSTSVGTNKSHDISTKDIESTEFNTPTTSSEIAPVTPTLSWLQYIWSWFTAQFAWL